MTSLDEAVRAVRTVLADGGTDHDVRVYWRHAGKITPILQDDDAVPDPGWFDALLAGRGDGDGQEVLVAGDGRAAVLATSTPVGEVLCVVEFDDPALVPPAMRRLAAVAAGIRLRTATAGHDLAQLTDSVSRWRAKAGLVDTLHAVGTRLTAQLDIDRVVQDATDAATAATGAAFGAFFYNLVDQYGESYTLYTLSGAPREAFSRFPMPRNTEVFGPTFDGAGTLRSDDIIADPRFGKNPPYQGMPEGHLTVRSYLAVSAVSPTTGEVLGGFFFGRPEPGRFTSTHEYLAEAIAGYAAIALDNARLFDRERNLVTELVRSMVPAVPEIPHLRIVTRYLPAATGIKVGGDWFDVLDLGAGRTAFVIGDVVGHGVTAAAVMGQVRTAVRSYALLDLSPSDLLRNVSQLTENIPDAGFVTCFYAVHDPADHTLTYANAGHLPAVLVLPDGAQQRIGEALAQPLGVGREFPQRQSLLPPGADLVLYTDGLVESRTRDLDEGIENLMAGLSRVRAAADTAAACDALIEELTHGSHDDDIAFIHVHHLAGDDDAVAELHRRITADAEHLTGVRDELATWATSAGMTADQRGDLVLAAYEALANACEHAYPGPGGVIDLHVREEARSVTVTVTDHGTWRPPQDSGGLRGRGLSLIKALADHMTVTHDDTGTTVTMTWSMPDAAT
jgi:anti-sigma regulatory factor (Ser/Thr protein kinase)